MSKLRQLLCTGFFLLLLAATIVAFVNIFSAGMYSPAAVLASDFDRRPMIDAVSVEAVSKTLGEILAFGSRAPGQEGLEKTADFIGETFRSLGLEVLEQDVDIPYPLSDGGKGVLEAGGRKIDVFPLAPNYAQPVATPLEGLEGTLFLATQDSLRQAPDFSGKIAVIDLANPPSGEVGVGQMQYASLGFKAIVYTHSSGLRDAQLVQIRNEIVSDRMPVNIVRVAAEPEILSLIGENANLKANSRWRNCRTRNVVGVLRAGQGNGDALVITATYDAASLLPDIAEGAFQALNVSAMLQMAKGLAANRDVLKRDVVFIATTGASACAYGQSRIVSTIGMQGKREAASSAIAQRIADNESRSKAVAEINALLERNQAFATPAAAKETSAAFKDISPEARKFLVQQTASVLRDAVFHQAEPLLRAGIEFRRNPSNTSSPEFRKFSEEKRRYDDLNNISALPLNRALERPLAASGRNFTDSEGNPASIREALVSRFRLLAAYHADVAASLARDKALSELFSSYGSFIVCSPRLHPSADNAADATETIAYTVGTPTVRSANTGEPANLFGSLVNDSIYALGLQDDISLARPAVGRAFTDCSGSLEFDSNPWCVASYPAFTLVNPRNSAEFYKTPFAPREFKNIASLAKSLAVAGEVVSGAARGYGDFGKMPYFRTFSMNGSVFAAGIGNSAIPNYPVANALVISQDSKPPVMTNPYGEYSHPFLCSPVQGRWRPPEAFHFNDAGVIDYVKDYGKSAQEIYSSTYLQENGTKQGLILYRGAPVAVLDTINPQSMKSFSAVEFISANGLAGFKTTCPFNGNGFMDFLPPDEYFFVTFKSGAPDNDLVSVTRSFCLGILHNGEDGHFTPAGEEIEGAGYLAAETPFLLNIPEEAEASMAWLASKRLDLQNRYKMADHKTNELHGDACEIAADDAQNGDGRPRFARMKNMRKALAYLILNHPVIRGSVMEAVLGILWYMGLLVPFTFFFEKLVFGFTDIRKQVMAQGGIFLVVFALLRILHPAFHMIRSSVMILLGFVIIIIVVSVTSVLSAKFQENIDAMRSARGIVKGAHGNTFGIVMTAFMLGLNNMHRRKVRTGLTCATLVLMTFVMICFTSVQSNVVEKERAIGHAKYQGILVRNNDFAPIPTAEVNALKSAYDENSPVCPRWGYTGSFNRWSDSPVPKPMNYEITAGSGGSTVTRVVKAGLGFTSAEPLRRSIELLTTNGWFTAEQEKLASGPYPVMLPDDVAEQLGITPNDVDEGPVPVKISGKDYFVWGIFRAASFDLTTDIDGETLLPYDCEAITQPRLLGEMLIADKNAPRLRPSDVILGIGTQLPNTDWSSMRILSVVIDMGGIPSTSARREINSYLVQTGRDTVYGLDGTAFNGRQARSRSIAGAADLIIPLIIAALTVLNTMKGSVYERKSEIFVYNAVGIAPKYVFFMFVAESLVYSVVGAVLGYILSQGTGRILSELGHTGGMNMNFTSVTTIYASLAIAAATLASTWFPARSAIEIAKPADDAGWSLPPPGDDDSFFFSLPFTFTARDRIAVLSFFHSYFDNMGEGSAGPFFSGPPMLKIADHTDPLANNAYIPRLEVQVWLKPFDLGVSQTIDIDLPTDPDTGEFIATMRIVRVTGTRDAWLRLNKPMVALIRQHFLHWRAVDSATKETYYMTAKAQLEEYAASAPTA